MSYRLVLNYIKRPKTALLFFLMKTARFWPDKLFVKIEYRLMMGEALNLKQPRTFTEKLQWLKLYNRRPEYTIMVDKYSVKQYVANKIGEEYIIPTIGVWDSVEDIDWSSLPNSFVLKTTHGGGGGGVVICKNKLLFNKQNSINILKKSLANDIYLHLREWPYKDVPKRIIAEKYMTESNLSDFGCDLTDYKFYCFNGEPVYCQVIRNRSTKETIDFYDMEWNHMPFVGLCPSAIQSAIPIAKPIYLNKMMEICRILSNDIPFLRVDLYIINERIFFGENTFFPRSGIGVFEPKEWNTELGDLLDIEDLMDKETNV